ncbi:unnamed protein product, partial [Closterium sp. NIES-54]
MTAQQQPPTQPPPVVHVAFARTAYRPGETVIATIDIDNFAPSPSPLSAAAASASIALPSWAIPQRAPRRDGMSSSSSSSSSAMGGRVGSAPSLSKNASFSGAGGGRASESEFGTVGGVLIENLVVDLKGVERLDASWIVLPKSSSGAQSKGERVILESQLTSLVTNVAIQPGTSKTYAIRAQLPRVLPPSYRGTAVRFHYQLTVIVKWRPLPSPSPSASPSPSPLASAHSSSSSALLSSHSASPSPSPGVPRRSHSGGQLGGEVGGGGAGKGEGSRGQGGSANTTPLKGRGGAEEGRGGVAGGQGKGKGGKGGQGGATSVVEVRVPLRIWTLPNLSGLTVEELDSDDHYGVGGIVPTAAVEVDIQWRERKSRAALM